MLHQCFKFDMIRFTGTELLLRNRALVSYAEFFCAPCIGSKNNYIFFDDLDELYHRAKFGEDRTTCAGCRCENVVFVTVFFVFHALRPERCSLEGDIVRTGVALPFFSERTALSDALNSSHFCH